LVLRKLAPSFEMRFGDDFGGIFFFFRFCEALLFYEYFLMHYFTCRSKHLSLIKK
jgi:hypothetical protein